MATRKKMAAGRRIRPNSKATTTDPSRPIAPIFVNYRRNDCESSAQHLAEDLERHFGPDSVFFDQAKIVAGTQWANRIQAAIEGCQVVVACVGREWHTQIDHATGKNRLDDPEDWVRRELEYAITAGIPIVPVLVDGCTELPKAELLRRKSLERLVWYQWTHVRAGNERKVGLQAVIQGIEPLLKKSPRPEDDSAPRRPVEGKGLHAVGLYFVTNRAHEGPDRWQPKRYSRQFSADGIESLRFGWLQTTAPQRAILDCLRSDTGFGLGDGARMAGILSGAMKRSRIEAYPESIDPIRSDRLQPRAVFGSLGMFRDVLRDTLRRSAVIVFVPGFNMSWEESTGTAMALQTMLNRDSVGRAEVRATVVLFSWASNALAQPFVAYKSHFTEARGSGYALGRGLLKLRDFLTTLGGLSSGSDCNQNIHVVCHGMGCYVLQCALERLREHSPGQSVPRLFDHVFLCAPDVESSVLEVGQPMGDLHQVAGCVSIYHNPGDQALWISDHPRGKSVRLGGPGAARVSLLADNIEHVDCGQVVRGLVEHSYFLCGKVADDLKLSLQGYAADHPARTRHRLPGGGNRWQLR